MKLDWYSEWIMEREYEYEFSLGDDLGSFKETCFDSDVESLVILDRDPTIYESMNLCFLLILEEYLLYGLFESDT
jgi:hypothetical protein